MFVVPLVNLLFVWLRLPQEQKWTDLALGSLAPDAALIDQLNITSI